MGSCFRNRIYDCPIVTDVWNQKSSHGSNHNNTWWVSDGTWFLKDWSSPIKVEFLEWTEHESSYSCNKVKILLTFSSITLAVAQLGVGSKGPPHVAAALAIKISNRPSVFVISETTRAISSSLDKSAAMEVAVPLIPGSLLSRSTAWFRPWAPSAFRDTSITFFAPANRKAVAECSPRPREPTYVNSCGWTVDEELTPCYQSNLPIESKQFIKRW